MPDDPSLFDYAEGRTGHYPESPGHRGTDTSIAAAQSMEVNAGTLRASCLVALSDRGPMTADEVAMKLGHSILAIRPRLTELRTMGLVEDSGNRRPNASGKKAIVWQRINPPKPQTEP